MLLLRRLLCGDSAFISDPKEQYDVVICGRESIDYNGAMVGGLIAQQCGYAFINTCVQLEIEGKVRQKQFEK
jgi:electron transfer flavoprotein alpha/beta subunit